MLYIHIGTQKTGSSSIQHALHNNEAALTKNSLRYLVGGRKQSAGLRIHHNPVAARLLAGDITGLRKTFDKEILKSPCRDQIISGELLSQSGVAPRLKEMLSGAPGDQIRIVIYLRRPDLYLESLFKQRVKADVTAHSAQQFLKRHRETALHLDVIEEFATCFGDDSIILRPFDRSHLVNGNAVDDFLHVIGMGDRSDMVPLAQDANTSFSLAFSEVSGLAVRNLGLSAPEITKAVQAIAPQGVTRSRDVYTLAKRRRIVAHHAEAIETLRRRFRPDLDGFFDMRDLAPDAKDPFPSAQEQVALMRDASAAMLQILPELNVSRRRGGLRRVLAG